MSERKLHTYLTTAEVADILHVSPKTVTRWAREGKLPHSRTLGGHRRYRGAEVRRLLVRSKDPGSPCRVGPGERGKSDRGSRTAGKRP